jgi:aminoglycoside phosphotransferase (APT) family kinase protein
MTTDIASSVPHGIAPPAQFSPQILTDALHAAGFLPASRRVVELSAASTEGGYLAQTVRLFLSYDAEVPGAPPSVIVKSPATEDQPRAVADWLGMYEREVLFYRRLAPTLDVRTPRCFLAELDPAAGSFALIIEDIADATVHDQHDGCPADDALLAIGQVARLHAAHWNDASLVDLSWLNHMTPTRLGDWHELFRHAWRAYLAREEVMLEPELIEVGKRLSDSDLASWLSTYTGPLALTHADFHLTNLLFSHDGDGCREVVTVDWQMAMHAPPLIDVAYFIGRMPTETRRANERDLVGVYYERLLDAGVTGYSGEACWEDYERCVWFGIVSAVAASAAYAMSGDQARRYTAKVARYLQQALDRDSLRFLS